MADKASRLTLTELAQLLIYAKDREERGWYYGNRSQFDARHVRIVAWLNSEIARYAKTAGQ